MVIVSTDTLDGEIPSPSHFLNRFTVVRNQLTIRKEQGACGKQCKSLATVNAPISVMTIKKDVPLTMEELELLIKAMTLLYDKSVRRAQRIEEVRSKKQTIMLAEQQKLLQYLAMLKNSWEREECQDFS